MKKLTPDDPRLTAYALGELNAAERAAIEAELEKSFACQQAVEEIRATAAALKKNLAMEELPDLTFAQQRKIENQLLQPAKSRTNWWRILFYGGLSAAAACLIVAMLLPNLASSKRKAQQIAFIEAPPAPQASAATKSQPEQQEATESLYQKGIPAETPASSDSTKTENEPTAPSPSAISATPPPQSAPTLSLDKKDSSTGVSTVSGAVTLGSQNSFASGNGGSVPSGSSANSVATATPADSFGSAQSEKPSTVTFATRDGGGGGGNRNLSVHSVGGISSLDTSREDFYQDDKRYNYYAPGETATYPHLTENSFLTALNHPLSTFSIDVDTASYSNVRRFLNEGRMPPSDAVRLEEMINYFHYDYAPPHGDNPFSANIEIAGCPWNSDHRLVRIGLKGREIAQDKRPPSNFVFLIDVSGSMQPSERLPLIKQALHQLVKKMTDNDRVAIVVYASDVGIKLSSTSCSEKEKILEAIDSLDAGGSTAGGAGIQMAYQVAQENFIKGGVNRVLLCTDGDFNVGVTDQSELVRIIEEKAKSGVALTTLGVGTDNYKDALMQKLADKGNGNYFYLDSLEEAQKVLIDQMSGTLVTIAKDVKIQVEFNPAQVAAYRLIGYEKRMLRKEDFNNDKKDAGEIGAGHTVTALYEIIPAGEKIPEGSVHPLKYQQPADEKPVRYVVTGSKELLTLKLRYKQPDGDTSKLLEFPVTDGEKSFARASTDFKFAAAVAEFGMLLRNSEFKGNSNYSSVLELAQSAKGSDADGYRSEFLTLVQKARQLSR